MLDIIVTKASVVPPYSLDLEFSDGTIKRVNLEKWLYGEVIKPLKNEQFFAKMRLETGDITVSWPNGADFAPEFLYELEPEGVFSVHDST